MSAGRPSKYNEVVNKTMLQLIPFWIMNGATELDIAKRLGIAMSTLCEWKNKYKEFSEALKTNRDVADDMVQGSLFKKAMAGDTTACIFWLKNRRPKEWRDKHDLEHSGKIENIAIMKNIKEMTDEELRRIINDGKTESD